MRLSMKVVRPCSVTPPTKNMTSTLTKPASLSLGIDTQVPKNLERLFHESDGSNSAARFAPTTTPVKRLNKRWMEYQGIKDWEGLLDPLDEDLRTEIIRYGHFVEVAYRAFDFNPSSPSYGRCQYPKSKLLERSGFPETGYRLTKNLRATSGIQLPRWTEKAPRWVGTQSSWIGYVAVCQDKEEIARLGRRDVVISFRGTATCLEWLENLRATLTPLPNAGSTAMGHGEDSGEPPMVESGFLSLYTSGTETIPSLQQLVREEIKKILQSYGDEPLSFTITGHSLGAALATLAAYDIKTTFNHHAPLVTVISFGGPRVGNRSFRHCLENQGTKVLRIVNSDDLITKVPGFVIDAAAVRENDTATIRHHNDAAPGFLTIPGWIQKRVEDTQWVYADVGSELRLSSRDSPYLAGINVATCHELKTYLHLVNEFESSACPFRATARKMMKKTRRFL
ncbi:phospholipase A(1) DAD1, chloroplastic-like [Camellia sinensis]|uniref:phospholipase A(1) DAD1, chloroplastic-like n=1 Tax=Camellia sinensis TaxID=4442 RepID=UPI0010358F5A|nr:phospholipase A(1) DAD1, chloroplastic-like [Camellia sinensis]